MQQKSQLSLVGVLFSPHLSSPAAIVPQRDQLNDFTTDGAAVVVSASKEMAHNDEQSRKKYFAKYLLDRFVGVVWLRRQNRSD